MDKLKIRIDFHVLVTDQDMKVRKRIKNSSYFTIAKDDLAIVKDSIVVLSNSTAQAILGLQED